MANLVRIGDTLINLDYLVSIEAPGPDPSRSGATAVHMDQGRTLYFEGDDADSVRRLVRSFTRFPASESVEAGPVGYSQGSEVFPDHGPKVHQAE